MEAKHNASLNLIVNVWCTLEEFYYGCQKNISFEKMVIMDDGIRQKMIVVTKCIHVKPGMFKGHKLTFSKEGHERVGYQPGDLVIEFN